MGVTEELKMYYIEFDLNEWDTKGVALVAAPNVETAFKILNRDTQHQTFHESSLILEIPGTIYCGVENLIIENVYDLQK